MPKWKNLSLRKLWAKLRHVNAQRRKQTRKGHDHPELDAQRRRLKKKIDWLHAHADPVPPHPAALLTEFDGHLCPTWIVEILMKARDSGLWHGYVISGYRSREYSQQLCYGLCERPSCPGTCAGLASNHACPPTYTGKPFEGAVDVIDAPGLQRYCRLHNNPLHGNGEQLPYDHNHFSATGR